MPDRTIYTPPEINIKRDADSRKESHHNRLRLYGVIAIIFILIGGGLIFFTDPEIISFLSGKNTPDFMKQEKKTNNITQPVAVFTNDNGEKLLATVGCVHTPDGQFAIAPLGYFEKIQTQATFHIVDTQMIIEAFGCLSPLLSDFKFGLPIEVTLGSQVQVKNNENIFGVFLPDNKELILPKE
ncbi:MAG: hypothetical protein JXR30_03490 [Alphaproteobacteria bacterium]|nr:hypothetical protein [Alphaproteobacteria bacterium]